MAYLLDINVLIALTVPEHIHHTAARRWFAQHRDDGWATTPVTEFGFARVASNPAAMGEAFSPGEALAVLTELRTRRGYAFWTDDVTPTDGTVVERSRLSGHRQLADAHLIALARRHDGSVATFDRAMATLAGADADARVALIPTTNL